MTPAEFYQRYRRLKAAGVGMMHGAMIHAQEHDGSALGAEWQTLPGMVLRTGESLRLALDLARSLPPNPRRIGETFAADRGAMLAEATGWISAPPHAAARGAAPHVRSLGRDRRGPTGNAGGCAGAAGAGA